MPDFQFHKGDLFLKEQSIEKIELKSATPLGKSLSQKEVIDATGCYVIPGLIDIHFHGCNGYDFCDGTLRSLHEIAAYEASQGITGICPASMTLAPKALENIMECAAAYHTLQNSPEEQHSETECSDFLGIHLEGPFLSTQKAGAQNPEHLRKPDITLLRQLQKNAQGLIRVVDIAPEEDAEYQFIIQSSSAPYSQNCPNPVISLAHTNADYTTCMSAFAAGASHVTHLFNAMTGFSHRAPGPLGAAFDSPNCTVELICDGIHVSPTTVRMAFQLFTEERIILVSDSMRATGMPSGEYTLGGQKVTVMTVNNINETFSNDINTGTSIATLADGTLAGSVTNLMECLRRAVSFGIPLEQALRCTTANPAVRIGVDDCLGFLKPGYVANIVILDETFQVKCVILRGKRIF